MKIFDYLFYRTYKYNDRPDRDPLFGACIFVAAQIVCLTIPIWYSFLYLFFKNPSSTKSLCVCFSIFLVVRIYYHRNKEVVLNRYKNSKYNRLIPTWVIFCITYLTFAIGVASGLYTKIQLLNPNWPKGALGDYILSLF